jgi:ubiquinone biosynthesis protein
VSSSLYRFFLLQRSYKKFRRYRDIAGVLARHGFADVATRTGLSRLWRGVRRAVSFGRWQDRETLSFGARLRNVCEQLGPTFIKFGQVLANRPDIFPPEVIRELARLQDQVPPFPFEMVEAILAQELKRMPGDVFADIERQPLAAASIAQVHRARLVSDEEVVVKVKRPGLEKIVRDDLAVLKDIAGYIEDNFDGVEHMHPRQLVEEFARTFTQEMDLRNEVRNMERFKACLADEPNVRIARAFDELCTENLIVMEFLKGTKVTAVTDWNVFPLSPKEISEIGTRLLLRSVFEFRFYHADPHPGNFMIADDGKVCLLDFGMMGFISEARMEEMLSFMVALVSHDSGMLVDSLLSAGLVPASADIRSLRRDAEVMMERFATLSIGALKLDELIRTSVEVMYRHKVSLPSDLLMVGRALGTMEGLARQIYPQFEPLAAVQPYLVSLFVKRALDPTQHSAQVVDVALDILSFARTFPKELSQLVRRLREGELKVQVQDDNLLYAAREKAASTNRLAGAVLAGAGVAASAFFSQAEGFPDWLSTASLTASFLVAVWVVLGIRKSGGM